jgi:antitoxin component YwqK of YwqJK toxin-antitoxin module
MKQTFSLSMLLVIITYLSTSAQDSIRTVIKTPRNGHSIYQVKRANDKIALYYVDDEKQPFTGKFLEMGWDGEKEREQNYVNGILEGHYIKWSGKLGVEYIEENGTYKNGKLFGDYTTWWRANQRKSECCYDSNGELHGITISYAGFGVEEPSSIAHYNHGKQDSTWTWFYSGGKIKSIMNFNKGKEHGDKIDYYENGNKKEELIYENGEKEGVHSKWYEDGKLSYTCEYKQGKKNGKEVFYYKNGQIKNEGEFINGDKKGHFVWYNSDGTIKEETNY